MDFPRLLSEPLFSLWEGQTNRVQRLGRDVFRILKTSDIQRKQRRRDGFQRLEEECVGKLPVTRDAVDSIGTGWYPAYGNSVPEGASFWASARRIPVAAGWERHGRKQCWEEEEAGSEKGKLLERDNHLDFEVWLQPKNHSKSCRTTDLEFLVKEENGLHLQIPPLGL